MNYSKTDPRRAHGQAISYPFPGHSDLYARGITELYYYICQALD